MLQELSVVEQRYLPVREVLDGAKVTDVATRYGIDRGRQALGRQRLLARLTCRDAAWFAHYCRMR